MEAITTVIGTVVVAIVGGLFTLFGQKLVAQSQQKNTEVTTRAEEWQKLMAETKAYMDSRIEDQRRQIEELQGDMKRVKEQLNNLNAKYRAALETIRRWLRDHPNHKLDVPEEIAEDLKSM